MTHSVNDPLRLVVVGGGVAGLDIATHLAGRRCGDRRIAVTLIDREPAYVWKPMLHTIAAGTSVSATQETASSAHDSSEIRPKSRGGGTGFEPPISPPR